ncbi:hypothetical protein X975_18351, partial [Stegodyphus mimosarum]
QVCIFFSSVRFYSDIQISEGGTNGPLRNNTVLSHHPQCMLQPHGLREFV